MYIAVGVHGIDSWLETTRQLISRADEEALRHSDQALVNKMVSDFRRCLPGLLAGGNGGEAAGRLKKNFATVQDFFRILLRQKARFTLTMPSLNAIVKFDPLHMEVADVGEEDDELVGRQIGLSVFPGIYKFGNEDGQHVSHHTSDTDRCSLTESV